jgi:hypothetical protein
MGFSPLVIIRRNSIALEENAIAAISPKRSSALPSPKEGQRAEANNRVYSVLQDKKKLTKSHAMT